jgi:hypothetical protein
MNVIFVKWGTKYSSEDVNTLYNNLKKYNNKHTYYCYTDNSEGLDKHIDVIWIPSSPRLKKWWNKLRMFAQEFPLEGKCMFFDIDTVVMNNPFKVLDQIDFIQFILMVCYLFPLWSLIFNCDLFSFFRLQVHPSLLKCWI